MSESLSVHLACAGREGWGSQWAAQPVGQPLLTGVTPYRSARMALTAAAVEVVRGLPHRSGARAGTELHFYAPRVWLLSEPHGPPQTRLIELATSRGYRVTAHRSGPHNRLTRRLEGVAASVPLPQPQATLHTDASQLQQCGVGGAAWVVQCENWPKPRAGAVALDGHSSTEVLEAQAVLEAARRIPAGLHARVLSDSLTLARAWTNGGIGNTDLLPVLHLLRDEAWVRRDTLDIQHIPRCSTPEAVWVDAAARWAARDSRRFTSAKSFQVVTRKDV